MLLILALLLFIADKINNISNKISSIEFQLNQCVPNHGSDDTKFIVDTSSRMFLESINPSETGDETFVIENRGIFTNGSELQLYESSIVISKLLCI